LFRKKRKIQKKVVEERVKSRRERWGGREGNDENL